MLHREKVLATDNQPTRCKGEGKKQFIFSTNVCCSTAREEEVKMIQEFKASLTSILIWG